MSLILNSWTVSTAKLLFKQTLSLILCKSNSGGSMAGW